MNNATKTRAIELQQGASYYAKEASIYAQCASSDPECPYRIRAIMCQRAAYGCASLARAIITE